MRKTVVLLTLFQVFTLVAGIELDGVFDWEKGKTEDVCKGVKYAAFELKSPRLIKAFAVRVDLKAAKFRFKITPRDKDWGKPMPDYPQGIIRTKRITCRDFMKNAVDNGDNMVVVVNGSPWGPFHAPWTFRYAGNQGLVVADGILVAPTRGKRPSFVVYKDGKVDFRLFAEEDNLDNVLHAISGFGVVLMDGKVTPKDNPKAKFAPRTGYGLSQDHRFLYLIAIDGRQAHYSMGATTFEVGQWLKYLGAHKGLNMDGGGSTTLIVRKNDKLKKLNSHAFGHERAVGGCMGIILD